MVKVLVFGMTQNPGGVESFIMNYYRKIDRSKIQFDFLCNFYGACAYEEEIVSMGGSVYHIAARSENYRQYRRQLKEFFEKYSREYQVIWVNVSSLANIDYLIYAKKYGIGKRIIHSHNSRNMDSRLRGLLHKINRTRIRRYATHFFACSESAADFFYRKKLRNKAVIIHNAIDLTKVSFSKEKAAGLRSSLGMQDALIVGNVGRLHFQKNQAFALDIMAELVKLRPDARLILVGQGEDEAALRQKAAQLNLTQAVYFAGIQKDMQAFLSAFDVFLFPSLFEGLSIAALEAQANGLPVVASAKVIHKDTKILPDFTFVGLDKPASVWAEVIAEKAGDRTASLRTDKETVERLFNEKGYNIETEVKKLEEMLQV